MNEKNNLMKRIRQYDFALKELNLYLDTHPGCRRGLELFSKYRQLREEAVREYNEKYGPLTPEQSTGTQRWAWVSDPWPWERS